MKGNNMIMEKKIYSAPSTEIVAIESSSRLMDVSPGQLPAFGDDSPGGLGGA